MKIGSGIGVVPGAAGIRKAKPLCTCELTNGLVKCLNSDLDILLRIGHNIIDVK